MGSKGMGLGSPKASMWNVDDFCLSRHQTIVWFNWTFTVRLRPLPCLLQVTNLTTPTTATGPAPASRPAHGLGTANDADIHGSENTCSQDPSPLSRKSTPDGSSCSHLQRSRVLHGLYKLFTAPQVMDWTARSGERVNLTIKSNSSPLFQGLRNRTCPDSCSHPPSSGSHPACHEFSNVVAPGG